MDLQTIWYAIIAILFAGFFWLEGFDYGVGILSLFLTKKDDGKRELFNSIGPVWDGNEVWMIVAGGAIFAAFPLWYATMFSSLYFALILILLGIALRGISLEFRGKSNLRKWRKVWDRSFFLGSLILALVWGVFVGNILRGIPFGPNFTYYGSFWGLLNPYSLLSGLMFIFLFCFHGATYLQLRLSKDSEVLKTLKEKLPKLYKVTLFLFIVFIIATVFEVNLLKNTRGIGIAVVSLLCLLIAGISKKNFEKITFVLSSLCIILITATVFVHNYPYTLISSLNKAWSLTIYNSCSTEYSMHLMLIVAICFVPLALIYQIFAYYIFRHRVTKKHLEY